MGREIRKVPLNWEHPKKQVPDYRTMQMVERYQPIYDTPYHQRAKQYEDDFKPWVDKKHPYQLENPDCEQYFWDYEDSTPDKDYYLPDWKEEDLNGFCLYETVSEGTPVSPVFQSLDELAQYLAEFGDFWDQKRGNPGWGIKKAKNFCERGWAPSMVMVGGSNEFIEGKLF